jgi:DNA replication and repair protein RecF
MIQDLRLQHFRSYRDETFEFEDGVNIIVGPNASGKTNLLEALLVTCLGNSYRSSGHGLIEFDHPWTRLESHTTEGERVIKLDNRTGVLKRVYELDGQSGARMSHAKTIPVVLFEPDHLRLLSGSPERRRGFVDDLLEQTTPGYGRTRRAYKRVLAQRNALLKKGAVHGSSQLFAWNIRLSELGGQIAVARMDLIEKLNKGLSPLYKKLSGDKTVVTLAYDSSCVVQNYSSDLLQKLEKSTDLDYLRGFTSYGPHREDIKLLFGTHEASDVASRGETRTLLLGLKIVELGLLEETRGQKPILLLDDVFSELDGARRQALTKYLSKYQTFITTTDADVVVQHFIESCHIIPTQSNK